MKSFIRLMDRVSDFCAVIAAILLFAAVLVITWMVFWRATGHSAFWEIEFSVYVMVAAIFLGSPYTLKTKGHVGVDLLGHYLPRNAARVLGIVTGLASLATCLYLAWAGWELTHDAFSKGETSGSLWNPPKWPLFAMMPLGLALTALQYVAEMSRSPEHLVPKPEDYISQPEEV
jgi:TRAP-type C4-dicarboxylate transport system permease small subunit